MKRISNSQRNRVNFVTWEAPLEISYLTINCFYLSIPNMQVMKKICILLSEDEEERSVEMGHSNVVNMPNTLYIKIFCKFSFLLEKENYYETMTSAEVYDLLRARYCIHNERLLFKNAAFKIIT